MLVPTPLLSVRISRILRLSEFRSLSKALFRCWFSPRSLLPHCAVASLTTRGWNRFVRFVSPSIPKNPKQKFCFVVSYVRAYPVFHKKVVCPTSLHIIVSPHHHHHHPTLSVSRSRDFAVPITFCFVFFSPHLISSHLIVTHTHPSHRQVSSQYTLPTLVWPEPPKQHSQSHFNSDLERTQRHTHIHLSYIHTPKLLALSLSSLHTLCVRVGRFVS